MKRYLSDTSFKISTGFLLATLTLLAIFSFVLQGELREKLENDSSKQVKASGNAIVAELVRQTSLVKSLAEGLGAVVSATPYSDSLYHLLLPQLISINNSNALVAGGGIWPEPNTLDPDKDKNSYFWGKNSEGQLDFYDDYNLDNGNGYHNEEWYVPAKYLSSDNCYWSRSYTDPFSKEPMVTCTVPMLKNNQYIGAATIDMKLDGLHNFLETQSKHMRGYVFLVDQNHNFITFPETEYIKKNNGSGLIDIFELASEQPKFKKLADHLLKVSQKTFEIIPEDIQQRQTMATYFDENSYQISNTQAETMAAAIIDPMGDSLNYSYLLDNFKLESDFLLQEEVNVSVFHVPESYWQLVVVTPTSTDFVAVSNIIKKTLKQAFIPTIFTMLVFFIFVHIFFIHPLIRISQHLRNYSENPDKEELLEGFGSGDFGTLADLYNKKTTLIKNSLAEISESNAQLQIHASYDDLTGTYNRRAFEIMLEETLQSNERNERAVFYLDLDQFKVVNDTAGHMAGDQLLKAISVCIDQSLRDNDILARIGGDEFAMIVTARSVETAQAIADRIRLAIAAHRFNWQGQSFTVSSSIGILHLSTLKGSKQKILSYVDSACFAAKEAGRNRNHLYLPEDDKLSSRFGEMESLVALRKGIDDNRLFVEYQLIKHINGTEPCGFEALVRMKDVEGNTIYPNNFMPAAERYNATWDVDKWVIEHTIAEFTNIKQQLEVGFCAINLTADALNHDQLLSTIKNSLLKNNIKGSYFCFEITETSAIANIDLARKTIIGIRQLGSRVSLDDFGTGMSSYSYLKELPVDYIKIDGIFVKNIENDAIDHAFVKSITDIANAMKIGTVAEWVEDEITVLTLKKIGVTYAQGFGISKPMSYAALLENKATLDKAINKRF
jgi:diguanylate cyclase (GGDEF)-like protein